MKAFFFTTIIIALAVFGFTGTVLSQPVSEPASGNPVSLNALLQRAYDSNPRIQAAKYEWQASVEMYPQLRSLPDPSLLYTKDIGSSGTYSFQLMQMIPNPRALSLKGKKALTMADMGKLRFEQTVRDVLVDVMKSYYELGYLDCAIRISETNRSLFSQMVDLGRLGNGQGKLGTAELYSAESRLAQAEYESRLLKELRQSEVANLRKLLNSNPDEIIGEITLPSIEPFEVDLTRLKELVNQHSQELEISGLSLELSKIDLSLARSMTAPDFTVGLMYSKGGAMGATDTGPTGMARLPMEDPMPTTASSSGNYSIMFGINLPIWAGKNRAMINEAKGNRSAAEANLKNSQNELEESTEKLYLKIKNLSRLVDLYRGSLLPQARQASELAQTWFDNGSAPFSQLLETRLIESNFELATSRAEADYLQAMADLSKLAGVAVTTDVTPHASIESEPPVEVSK